MAAELLGAKLLAPFYGSSLYVWASVMAVTLIGLAFGYFMGGFTSVKADKEKRLYLILIAGAIIISLMPFIAQFCFALFAKMNLLTSVVFSSLVLLVPPVMLMGMVSPLIIGLIDGKINNSAKSSGIVYAISTVGGIIATFSFGFYIIPTFGLSNPCYIAAGTLALLPAIQLIRRKNIMPLVLIFSIWFSAKSMQLNRASKSLIKIIDFKEGVLGQLLVVDYPNDYYYNDSTKKNQFSRWLYVNRISQTMDDRYARRSKGEERFFTYVYKIADVLDTLAKGKSVLLLGLGGGSVANYLTNRGYNVTACELDNRIYQIAQKYFCLNNKVKVVIDDARHFINVCEAKYDVIIFDTFKGEETPNHVFTGESLTKVKSLLKKNGLVFVNSFGYWNGKRGLGMRSIYKTFTKLNFNTVVIPTEKNEDQRNLLFLASIDRKIIANDRCLSASLSGDEYFLLDNFPVFEKLNAKAALSWRKSAIQSFLYDSLQSKIPFFQ